MDINYYLKKKRRGLTFFNFTTFPLFTLFLGSLIVLGQTSMSYQTANPFGLSNVLQGQTPNPFTFGGNILNPNLSNVTIGGKFGVTPPTGTASNCNYASSWQIFNIFGIPIGTLAGTFVDLGCDLITTVPAIISTLVFSTVVSSGNPVNVNTGFTSIILGLCAIVLVSGISVAGTGLNTASIFLTFQLAGWLLLWIILSSISYPLWYGNANSIPDPFGNLFFFLLTALYTIGVLQRTL